MALMLDGSFNVSVDLRELVLIWFVSCNVLCETCM